MCWLGPGPLSALLSSIVNLRRLHVKDRPNVAISLILIKLDSFIQAASLLVPGPRVLVARIQSLIVDVKWSDSSGVSGVGIIQRLSLSTPLAMSFVYVDAPIVCRHCRIVDHAPSLLGVLRGHSWG